MLYRSFFASFFLCTLAFGNQEKPANQSFCKTGEIQNKLLEELKKKLADDYQALMDALGANNLAKVKTLFDKNLFLKQYAAHHEQGAPLECARSKEMAQLLVEQVRFSANACDQWGEMPSKTILETPNRYFVTPQDKQEIADYYKAHEGRLPKLYYQLTRNKKVQSAVLLIVVTTFIVALDLHLLSSLN